MKKIIALALCLVPSMAFALETPHEEKFDLNIRRIGIEWTKTTIDHAGEYTESPVSAFTASNQDSFVGVFDTALEYGFDRLRWDNSLFMTYGKSTIKPYGEHSTTDEKADKILFLSDLAYAVWDWDDAKLGPIVRAEYETEFVGNPRIRKILRPSAGIALFDHKILKTLYVTAVYEDDFTHTHDPVSKFAMEAGWRAEYDIREGVKFTSDGYYREYLDYSKYVPTDFRRDLSVNARLDTNLWGDFTFGPYVNYRRALARAAEHYGANTTVGLSFNYINKFNLKSAETLANHE
ncbi:MAG: hypothetical protein J5608_02640 [Alphaproteobacteria bacterium]|nr:hypothetical protein [Alphaproteobacteria bacterium]